MSLCTAVIGKTSIVKKGKIASICDSTCCYASSLVATAYKKNSQITILVQLVEEESAACCF